MTAQPETERPHGGLLQYEISNALVALLREYTGRGPTKARTTIRDNVVVVMLEQTLTKGERVLVDKGRSKQVLALRHEYQEAMREESSTKVAEITGRRVVAFLSANHVDPDLAAEIYVLDGPPNGEAGSELPALNGAHEATDNRIPAPATTESRGDPDPIRMP